MRRTIKLVTLAAMLALFAAPALAQSKECNDENKAAWYDTFLKNYKGEPPQQKIAYDAAKLYLDSCPADPTDKIAEFMRVKFVEPYIKMMAAADVAKQFEAAINNKNYAEQMRLGKLVLATDPDNLKVYIILAVAGLNDQALLADSSQYAKKAIEMIEGGKSFAPLFDSNKDKALANLTYAVAKATAATAPTDAIRDFLKAARFQSEQQRNPQLYLDLADAYEKGPRAKLSSEYKSKIAPDGTETPESKLVLANLNQVVDRQIDAWARAAALATDANTKKLILDDLTALYKYRNKSDAGLNELVAGILAKPLPDIPTPLTSLPTPVSTPATNGSPSGTNGATSSNTGTNGQTKSGLTGGVGAQNVNKTTNGAKPSPSPTPGNKPKPRRANHSHG
jgi:hypothetical protein